MVNRVEITEKASEVVERLKVQHGALMFHQSGGCCDGSAPMCYPVGDFQGRPAGRASGRASRAASSISAPPSSNTGGTRSSSSMWCPAAAPGFPPKRRKASGS